MQEMKIGQEVRSPVLLTARGVIMGIMVTTLWASMLSSIVRFRGEQTGHVPQGSRAGGYEGERIEQVVRVLSTSEIL